MYKEVWEASHGKMLSCTRETGNTFDPFTVCMKNHGCTVLGWINFCGEEVCHVNHENFYTYGSYPCAILNGY